MTSSSHNNRSTTNSFISNSSPTSVKKKLPISPPQSINQHNDEARDSVAPLPSVVTTTYDSDSDDDFEIHPPTKLEKSSDGSVTAVTLDATLLPGPKPSTNPKKLSEAPPQPQDPAMTPEVAAATAQAKSSMNHNHDMMKSTSETSESSSSSSQQQHVLKKRLSMASKLRSFGRRMVN